MKRLALHRRSVLRGAGLALALPWLEAMSRPRTARAATPPRRFIGFFSPNGTIRDAWRPAGGTTDFTLSRILAPLAPHRSQLVIIDGVDNRVVSTGPGDPHQKGIGTLMTGTALIGSGRTALGGGISVDQELVRRLRPPTRFPSLELGVQLYRPGTVWGYLSYRGSGQPLPPEQSPRALFGRLFGDMTSGGETAIVKLRAARKSVIDGVSASYRALVPKLGGEDRQRLEAHLSQVQELEKRLFTDSPTGSSRCTKPTVPSMDFTANGNFPATLRLQIDLMIMALACDLTRIATLVCGGSIAYTQFSWLGVAGGHHALSHEPESNTTAREGLTKINSWYSEQFAYLLAGLKAVPQESGTLLDHALVLWGNELSRGNNHAHSDIPFVLAGRAGGRLQTGRVLRPDGISHNNLLVSVLNAFDVPATVFGNPEFCTGPLPGVL